jgi:hypothetical protein
VSKGHDKEHQADTSRQILQPPWYPEPEWREC